MFWLFLSLQLLFLVMMLIQFDYLKTPLGGIIAVAAMVDDVASLVILAVLQELQDASGLASSDTTAWAWLIIKPLLISLGVISAGGVLCWLVPLVFRDLRRRLLQRSLSSSTHCGRKTPNDISGDELNSTVNKQVREQMDVAVELGLLVSTFAMVVGAGYAGSSYLLGAFAAGMAFSQLRDVEDGKTINESRALRLWERHATLSWWLASVCFATIGFSIPAEGMLQSEGFGIGLLYVIPAALGKFVLGSFAPGVDGKISSGGFYGNLDDALILGFAMVARGELGFVMAQQSFQAGVLQETNYVACVWALFVCTLVPPFFFGWALRRKQRKTELSMRPSEEDEVDEEDDEVEGGKGRKRKDDHDHAAVAVSVDGVVVVNAVANESITQQSHV